MHYLIDTYNLLHTAAASGGPLGSLDVRLLCRHLSAAPNSFKATLILDGRPKPDEPSPNEFPDIGLVYSGTGVKADTVIAQMIERSPHRKKLSVVTNDRAVALHARRHNAGAMSCEQFLDHLIAATIPGPKQTSAKPTPTQSPAEIDHWLRQFGLADPNPTAAADVDPLTDIDIEDLLGPRGE